MTQRRKLELDINKPTEITLLFDEPISGKSQYGNYYMYAINSNGTEYTYFAPELVHSQLKNLRRGNRAIITKLASKRGNGIVTSYDVKLTESNPEINSVNTEWQSEYSTDTDLENVDDGDDGLYEIMLLSYKQALQITSELGGLADPSRIAITLFIARSKFPTR